VNFLDALNAARKKATKRAHFRKLTTISHKVVYPGHRQVSVLDKIMDIARGRSRGIETMTTPQGGKVGLKRLASGRVKFVSLTGRKPKKTKHISFTTASGEVVDFRVSGKRKRARAAKRRDRANFQGLDLSNLVLTL
jgi:hypothetical protein